MERLITMATRQVEVVREDISSYSTSELTLLTCMDSSIRHILSHFTHTTCHFKDQHEPLGNFETCGNYVFGHLCVVSSEFVSNSELVTIYNKLLYMSILTVPKRLQQHTISVTLSSYKHTNKQQQQTQNSPRVS